MKTPHGSIRQSNRKLHLTKICNESRLKTLRTAAPFAVSFLVKNALSYFFFSAASSVGWGVELWIIQGCSYQDRSLRALRCASLRLVNPLLSSNSFPALHLPPFIFIKIHNPGRSACMYPVAFLFSVSVRLVSFSPSSPLCGHMFCLSISPFTSFRGPPLRLLFDWKICSSSNGVKFKLTRCQSNMRKTVDKLNMTMGH